jgi:DNA polymerase-1
MAERTLVASGSNLLTRGFLVTPTDRVARDRSPAGALFAVARAIRRVIGWKTPARAVAVIEQDPARDRWPPLLAAQLAPLPELLAALGFTVAVAPDEVRVVAAYARAAVAAGDDAVVIGVDKRYAQLVGDRLSWYDANKDVRYTPEIVTKRFGVGPEHVAGWLGLVGDDDALPGVAGIGAKGATTLVQTYGSIDAAIARAPEIAGRLGNALRAAQAEIPRELARGSLDPPPALPLPLDRIAYAPPHAAELNAHLDRLGFVELLVADGEAAPVDVVATDAEVRAALAGKRALHALVEDDGAIAGIAVAGDEGAACYVPRGAPGWPALAAWLADPAAEKLGHDLVGTIVALASDGVALAGVVGDSACASHLTQPSNWAPHDLAVISKHVQGRAIADVDQVRGVGAKRKTWGELPIERAAEHAGACATAALAIWKKLAPEIPRANLDEYLALERTCARMERAGILVDRAELDRAEAAFADIEAALTSEIEALAGHPFNINSGKQLGAVLFEELKLPVVGHTKTGWSTAIETLERIDHAHPIVPLVIRWRLLRRLRDSWVIALRRCIGADGRVHSRFHPARSFSGHLVNTNPDLGRVPGRTPEMAMIRRAFVAAPGRLLVSVDFSQLGLYVLAHLTKDPALVKPLRERADLHRLTAAAVLDKPADSITPDERQLGKVINFATFAGQGASALALQLNVPAAEAKEYIARFDRRYVAVRAFQDEQLRLVRERGYIETIAGRRWPIGGLESLDSQLRSYAERLARRATHEGSVSDVSRRALLDADRALAAAGLDAAPILQVVDEVMFDVAATQLADAARVAAEAMKHAFELEVPLVVGVEAGTNWADLTPVTA